MGMTSSYRKLSSLKLAELQKEPENITAFIFNQDESNRFDLDKSWHAIHFLVTHELGGYSTLAGSVIHGGTPISDEDMGYGPARYFVSEEVKGMSQELNNISTESLFENYAHMLSQSQQVYPGFEDTTEDKEYIESYFTNLKAFLESAANENKCLITWLS